MGRLFKKYLNGYRAITLLGIIFKFLEAIIELIIPLVVTRIIDIGIKELADLGYVVRHGMLMLLLYVVGFIFACTCQYFAAKSAFGFGTNLRRALYKHINTLPLFDTERLGTPTLLTRLSLDVNNVQNTLNRLIRLVSRAPFIIIGSLIIAVIINPTISLSFFAASALLSLSLYLIVKKSSKRLRTINIKHDEVTLLTKENLSGARVVRAFNKQAEEEADFKKTSVSLRRQSIILGLLTAFSSPVTFFIINSAVIYLVYVGAFEVNSGSLTQGNIISLNYYLVQILNSMLVMALLINFFTKGAVSAKRINDVLILKEEDENGEPLPDTMDDSTDALVFNGVSMSYGGGDSLKNISFTLKKGQTLGIIGSTGSGKTTLVSLIAKLYNYKGEIEYFGSNLSTLSPSMLRDSLAYAPQKSILFSGTVRDNLLMSYPNATEEEMFNALKAAQCNFIKSLDTIVARGGANFSGGQKQRLCIARALVRPSHLLILDDSTSALDYSTEAAVKRELNKLKDLTKIIVTQRIFSIKNADLILVIENGEAVGLGTHAKLLKSCPVYKEINDIQGEAL